MVNSYDDDGDVNVGDFFSQRSPRSRFVHVDDIIILPCDVVKVNSRDSICDRLVEDEQQQLTHTNKTSD